MGNNVILTSTKERNGGIDLFKTLSMFMVVVLHVQGHGGILFNASPLSAIAIIGAIIEALCIIAVNCFALTSGYLCVDRKVKLKNIVNLWMQVFFYSIGFAVVFFVLGKEAFSVKTFFNYLFPVISVRYWYFSAYFLLFLSMPLLNLILKHAEKKFMICVIAVGAVLFGVYEVMSYRGGFNAFDIDRGYSFLWLAFLYLTGGAVKKYNIKFKFRKKEVKPLVYLVLYFVFTALNLAYGTLVSYKLDFKRVLVYYDCYNFISSFLSGLCLLLFFANIKVKSTRVGEFFAKTSFGVYIIHCHPFISKYFMEGKFNFVLEFPTLKAVLFVFLIAIIIYCICTVIEYIRQVIFKLIRLDKIGEIVDKKIDDIYNKTKENVKN